jgi:ribosomal-protein-alanine N-acetyltransferase
LAPLLAEIHQQCFGGESWNLEQMRGSLGLETTKGWIAYRNNIPAGFILCQTMVDQTEILTFCVRPAQQRKNIGAQLLQKAIDTLGMNGKFFLEVAADNRAARALYEKLGFKITGTRTNYYKRGAVTVDAVMYEMASSL